MEGRSLVEDVPITVEGEPLAFERRENEGPEAWDAFVTYRDLGSGRSLKAVARAVSKSEGLMARWSGQHEWQRRCFEYDTWLERTHREAVRLAVIERGKQHADVLDAMITSLAQPALALAERIHKDGGLKIPEDADPAQFLAMVAETAKVMPRLIEASRLVNGMSTANVDHSGSAGAPERRTDEEVDEFLLGIDDGSQALLESGYEEPVDKDSDDAN
jgi:hypothetical protein